MEILSHFAIRDTWGTSSDSVWNFHVWSDLWLNRSDLPLGYGGWNCTDGCPVITRFGIEQCGPAPLNAIKNGDTFIQHDTGFMFSCVNADTAEWLVREEQNGHASILGLLARNRYKVGSCIVTKEPNRNRVSKITDDYKFAEGSQENKVAWEKALTFVGLNYSRNRTKMQKELLGNDKMPMDLTIEVEDGQKNWRGSIAQYKSEKIFRRYFRNY